MEYQNTGIASPLTAAVHANLEKMAIDDIYALFAGGDVEHEEIHHWAVADLGKQHQAERKRLQQFIEEMSQSEEFKDAKASGGKGKVAGSSAGSTGAPGWLMAMAQALGEELDRLGQDMQTRAESLKGDDASASAEFGVVSQQFSMLMNATNNAIKTIGEAMSNTARKQ